MKKILISILIILLIILAYFAMFNGVSLGKLKILSAEQIVDADENLTQDIEDLQSLLKKEYPNKEEELNSSVSELLDKKEEYYKLAKASTEAEMAKANTEETYLIEYLWTRVGRHATSNGVTIKMDVNSGDIGNPNIKNLNFTVTGDYIEILQFVEDLENDDKLAFKIENFKMFIVKINPGTAGEKRILTATFSVRNVRIRAEKVSTSIKNDNTEKNDSEVTNTTVEKTNTVD